ncbi:VPLPA-CTERM sorting domain-containing protein [Pseudooceanicola sp. LIPI14-2-Ac024]|uniref:VPLPA-CTERM sorting domain-containing protein n=1 Tax=Pseudooceanicola sp. LIPI14-2-Ac024 TaxID=3344875 RepID=UPI0035CEA07D
MTNLIKATMAAAALTLFASAASALTITTAAANCDPNAQASALHPGFADFAQFACGTSAARQDIDNVNLGAADGKFFSLGLAPSYFNFGGTAVFEISPSFTGPSTVVEVTNTPSNHWEAAAVFVANSLSELFSALLDGDYVGIVNNGKGGTEAAITTVNFSGTYSWIAFADVSHDYYGDASAGNRSQDGFDLDSFTVSAVPVPAGGLLLISALAGAGFLRRRKS